jgi:hypothetical protein
MAYVLGPVMAALWSTGKRRIAWWILGPGSVAAGVVLAGLWPGFTTWLESIPNGVVVWLAVVAVVVLSAATAWARAIAAVSVARTVDSQRRSRWHRDPRVVAGFGLIVPGLGLTMAGRPRRAACAFWIAGPMAAAALVLVHRDWLWERGRSAVTAGISGNALEVVFIAAAGVAVAALVAWVVQALDGVRLVSERRSHAAADAASIVLLVSLVLLVATSRPASFARHLHSVSNTLRLDGYRLIPLGMCEAAARLDPVTPAYLADAAELNEAMGMNDAALDKRQVIERRAEEYFDIVRGSAAAGSATSPAVNRSLDTRDHSSVHSAGPWPRTRVLSD